MDMSSCLEPVMSCTYACPTMHAFVYIRRLLASTQCAFDQALMCLASLSLQSMFRARSFFKNLSLYIYI